MKQIHIFMKEKCLYYFVNSFIISDIEFKTKCGSVIGLQGPSSTHRGIVRIYLTRH